MPLETMICEENGICSENLMLDQTYQRVETLNGASTQELAPAPSPVSTTAPPPRSQDDFLRAWRANIEPKFIPLLSALAKTEAARSLLLGQIYTFLPVLTEGKQLLRAEKVCLLGSSALESFHATCHVSGVSLDAVGPMGKVWEKGDVQVVQYPSNLPCNAYPMDRMPQQLVPSLGALVFLPMYDSQPGSPTQGIVAVIELILSRRTADAMIVATMISTLESVMETLGLSLSAPSQRSGDNMGNMETKSSSFHSNNSAWTQPEKLQGMQRTCSRRNVRDW